jgi:hypothetical protein
LQNELSPETKLSAALSILSHPAVTPDLRARSEKLRSNVRSLLTPDQIESAEKLAKEKNAEEWAREILN